MGGVGRGGSAEEIERWARAEWVGWMRWTDGDAEVARERAVRPAGRQDWPAIVDAICFIGMTPSACQEMSSIPIVRRKGDILCKFWLLFFAILGVAETAVGGFGGVCRYKDRPMVTNI
jgi:hypothetical protein